MKRASRKTKLVVGLFVVVAAAIVAVAILTLGDAATLFRGKTTYVANFPNVDGLQPGAPVKLGGVEIGSVERIDIKGTGQKPEVVAKVEIYQPYNRLVREGATLGLQTAGVLGDKFLVLEPGEAGDLIPEGGTVQVRAKTELAAAVEKSSAILDSVASIAERLDTTAAGLPKGPEFERMSRDLAVTLSHLRSVSSHLNSPESQKKLDASLDNLYAASTAMASIARKVDQGEGTLGALVNDTALYDDVRTLLGRANRSKALRFVVRQAMKPEEEEPQPTQVGH